MIEDKVVYAIIPARGGSKRIPRKNLTKVGGVALVERAVQHAHSSQYVDHVFVSTDDPDIKKAVELSSIVVDRPKELSTDTSPTEEAIEDWLRFVRRSEYDTPAIIALLQCTSPFRDFGQLDGGIELLVKEEADSLFFGCPVGRWIWTLDNRPINYDYTNRMMTQDKQWELMECGDFVFTTGHFKRTGCRLGGKIIHLEIGKLCAVDIDDETDLRIANLIAEAYGL